MNSNRTPERAAAFCAALSEACNVGKACKAIGISRSTAYAWRDADPAFAADWDAAMKVGITALEDEAHRRAFDGCDKPLVHQGQFTPLYERDASGNLVFEGDGELKKPRMLLDENGQPRYATMKEYSDTLAIFLPKAHDPAKYREQLKIDANVTIDTAAEILAARNRGGGTDVIVA